MRTFRSRIEIPEAVTFSENRIRMLAERDTPRAPGLGDRWITRGSDRIDDLDDRRDALRVVSVLVEGDDGDLVAAALVEARERDRGPERQRCDGDRGPEVAGTRR